MLRLYGLLTALVSAFLPLVALWNTRVRAFQHVRKGTLFQVIPDDRKVIWMHCSSLGEFEQGRPVWEGMKNIYPDAYFLLSFFSRSGYDRQKDNFTSDRVVCLPLDTRSNARNWMDQVHPNLILWVKYDFWFHYWQEAHRRQIPVVLFAARFRPDQFLTRSWARPFRELILKARTIAVQDQDSLDILRQWGYPQPLLAGDPRIDRVLKIAASPAHDPWIEAFTAGQKTVVCGSVWDEDVNILRQAMLSEIMTGWRWILAPHDLSEERIQRILDLCGPAVVRYTAAGDREPGEVQVMVLDTIGMLNQVYRWGQIAWVGGGFGRSVHNLLEPAVYGLPVLFGPNHSKFPEAAGLIRAGGGFEVRNADELKPIMNRLNEDAYRQTAGDSARKWLDDHAGATALILAECRHILGE